MYIAPLWPRRQAGLAVALVGLALGSQAGGAEPAAEAGPFGALEAEVIVTGMTFVASRGSVSEFALQAERGVFVPDTRIAHLTQMNVVGQEGSAGEDFAVRCDRGELDVETNNFFAEGNVEGTAADGREYAAPWVRYQHDKALLYTDAPVVMRDATGTFRGDGFRYFVRERRFRLLGNVSLVGAP